VGTHWVSQDKNNAKLYENRMTTGKEVSISEKPMGFCTAARCCLDTLEKLEEMFTKGRKRVSK
jgi:hypothetical protein